MRTVHALHRTDAPKDLEAREQNKATARILTVLSEFAVDGSPKGVTELSEKLGMSKNMVYRALTTLVQQGYLVRNESEVKYELGYRIIELQNPNFVEPDLRSLCAPYIRKIFELTGETVCLSVRSDDHIVFIDGIETRLPGIWRLHIGRLRPLDAKAASARVTLAFLPDEEIEGYLARRMRATGQGSVEKERIWKDIREIRKRGYAVNYKSLRSRMVAIAFPIWGDDERLHAVIATGGPEERADEKLMGAIPQVEDLMRELKGRIRLYSLETMTQSPDGEE
jgi:DNA-binding IclR family transcriptional regulator